MAIKRLGMGAPSKTTRVKPKAGAKPKAYKLEELQSAQGYIQGLIARLLKRGPRKAATRKRRTRRGSDAGSKRVSGQAQE